MEDNISFNTYELSGYDNHVRYTVMTIGYRGCRGCHRMVVGFTTTYATRAYQH
jgi:hypothetical protein